MKWTICTLLGVFLFTGCTESQSPVTENSSENTSTPVAATPVVYESGQTLTVNVPDMHCPFACYPKVKDTLNGQEGVESVELVKQEDEGTINDPRVIVKLKGEFDASNAIDALSKVGFSEATVVSVD